MSNTGGNVQRTIINRLEILPKTLDGLWCVKTIKGPITVLYVGPREDCKAYAKRNIDYVKKPRGHSRKWAVHSSVSGPIVGPWVYGRARTWLEAHKRALALDYMRCRRLPSLPSEIAAQGEARDVLAVFSEGHIVNYLWIEQAG